MHRLDKGTSGLLVVARTEPAYHALVAQLAARTVHRRYLALVAGHLPDDRGWSMPRSGARPARRPAWRCRPKGARPAPPTRSCAAWTTSRPVDAFPATLLSLALETGRTHQIRVHLAAIGHPVVGDDRYGRPTQSGDAGSGGAGRAGRVGGALLVPGRLFLHAAELGFVHPGTGEPVMWRSPLPPDLAAVLGDGAGLSV